MNYSYKFNFSNFSVSCNKGGLLSLKKGVSHSSNDYTFTQNKFYYILNGKCRIIINNTEYIGIKDDWFFIPAGAKYSYTIDNTESTFEKYWMHFDIYPDNKFFEELSLPYVSNAGNNPIIKSIFSEYYETIMQNKTSIQQDSMSTESMSIADKLLVKSFLLRLLSEYVKQSIFYTVSTQEITDSKISEILRYINRNVTKNITIKELADLFQMSPSNFIKYFKKQTNYTPAKWIKSQKLHYAKVCLEKTDMYIYEIMEAIGETNPTSFSKQFKSQYSISPSKYRKENNKKV